MGNATGGGGFAGGGAGGSSAAAGFGAMAGGYSVRGSPPVPADVRVEETFRWLVPRDISDHALAKAARSGCHAANEAMPIGGGCKAHGELHPAANGQARAIVRVELHAPQLPAGTVQAASNAFRDAFEASLRAQGVVLPQS